MADVPQIFNGRYEIVRKIARGGMADVFLARDLTLDRHVALKVLFRELSTDENFVERFRREAQAAANLAHPNIVSIYDWGEDEGTYFIVMEYVEGTTLSGIIRNEGRLLPDRAAVVGADIAAALAFAHQNGVVHRDVKPGNVLIDTHGRVKVTDFGIARAANTNESLTQTGAVMGTATYFSPEQAQGITVDKRSDVYSLGVVLYEMVTGQAPFVGDNPVAIAAKHVGDQPVPPRERNPQIPAAFEAIVLTAMAKRPGDRFASAEELRADLVRFRQGRTVQATPPTIAATQAIPTTSVANRYVTDGGTAAMPAAAVAAAPKERRTDTYVILLFAMLAVLAVLLFFLARALGIVGGGNDAATVEVPSVIGLPVDQASQQLEELNLKVQVSEEPNEADEGIVFDQDPRGQTKVDAEETITLKVSSGPEEVEVPDVVGEKVEDATETLEEAGFEVATQEEESDFDKGQVLNQDPDGDEKAAKGSTITLTISGGRGMVTVPNVANRSESDAIDRLEEEGLDPQPREESSDDVPKGRVIRTDPAGGSSVERGSPVVVVVSSGPKPTTTTTSSSSTTVPSSPDDVDAND